MFTGSCLVRAKNLYLSGSFMLSYSEISLDPVSRHVERDGDHGTSRAVTLYVSRNLVRAQNDNVHLIPISRYINLASARYGSNTVSITWMTPLRASTSTAVTVAPPMVTLPSATFTGSDLPCSVRMLLCLATVAAGRLPLVM